MVDIKNTLNELKAIISDLETHATSTTALTGTDLANLKKRLEHVKDKSQPRHTNLSADLNTDLKDIENIDKTIGAEKLKTDAEIKKLTDEKTQLTTDLNAKDALLKEKDEAIGNKITKDLIDKLEKVSKLDFKKQPKKNADGTDMKDKDGNIIYEEIVDLSPLKTLLTELKDKKVEVDSSKLATNDKLDEVKNKLEEVAKKESGSDKSQIGV
ncbi:2212_t:CDS:1 [Ambispora gerdemannii]|uniref:2212_t:CDS:1 n=1 Tax=Ambispora gerdemannii TaxID=144530 RepID=A0A9N9DST1_9GLOM|nr:2212_t:CDS:1 [Ambispora gerdemannii]